ncbi:DsbA family protein [Tabrizicola fusiformis]|uniref:DsbA family protein n=1 Tax=Tabrizicola sp. SY72 TaxID=2741673 RepID=UPI0015733303|nr:DsbA family protein [Tabrizicola sp. SY72]NTT86609.1 DsbA family protein [Tabrizicola sp. SY72]
MRPILAALPLAIALMGTAAHAEGAAPMTEAERAAFRAEVRAYLLENPEVLIEAMDVLQSREAETAAARDVQMLADNKEALLNDPASWVGGNPQGDITIVEFTDYRCGYCRKAFAEVEELVKSDGNIRFVLKEFPILGEDSMISSRFAIAVRQLHGDEAYKKAHDALITLRGSPDAATLGALAVDLGLEAGPIIARMNADEVTAVIAANHAMADKLQITGTPTFVLGDQLLRGYVPLDAMRQLVEDERAG